MPIDPQRLARVRAHLLAAAAVASVGCGGNDHTVNEPVHTNEPIHINPGPDTTAAPSATPTATPSGTPNAKPPEKPPENG